MLTENEWEQNRAKEQRDRFYEEFQKTNPHCFDKDLFMKKHGISDDDDKPTDEGDGDVVTEQEIDAAIERVKDGKAYVRMLPRAQFDAMSDEEQAEYWDHLFRCKETVALIAQRVLNREPLDPSWVLDICTKV